MEGGRKERGGFVKSRRETRLKMKIARGRHTRWRDVVLMINARPLVRSQHLEQQLNRDIEDKSSGRVTVERRLAPLNVETIFI